MTFINQQKQKIKELRGANHAQTIFIGFIEKEITRPKTSASGNSKLDME
jgi:hypothetical protein